MSEYTRPELLTHATTTATPTYGRSASGYGPKVPTRYLITYAGRVRRVYMMQYGNSGSAYVVVNGADVFLDIASEYALASLRTGETVASEYAGADGPGVDGKGPGSAYVVRDAGGMARGIAATVHDAIGKAHPQG